MIQETLKNKLIKIATSDLGKSMYKKYTNRVALNGFVMQKPKFITSKIGRESCYFTIHQTQVDSKGVPVDKFFSVITYLPRVIEIARQIDKYCCFVNLIGTFERNPKRNLNYCQVFDMEISLWLDEELEPEYESEQ